MGEARVHTLHFPHWALVRIAFAGATAESWSLALTALAIEHHIQETRGAWAFWVAGHDLKRAAAVLAAQDREAREAVNESDPPAPDLGPSGAGVMAAVTMGAFFLVTGNRDGPDRRGFFRLGSAVAERIVHGEPWRAVTALTLHADPSHVLGNAAASLIFITAVGRWVGDGVALLAVLLAGVAGNLLTAYAYGSAHNSVGASTATFGALGLLGGLQIRRWLQRRPGVWGRRRRALTVIAACLGLFAMLGVGPTTDVLAHVTGMGMGLLLGPPLGRFTDWMLRQRRPARTGVQLVGLLATAASIWVAWWRAMR